MKKVRAVDEEECREMLSFACDDAVAPMNSTQLWFPARPEQDENS